MNGIAFGNYHSYNDFGLVLSSKVIGYPSVKKTSIDVPGADGELDFTDFFGQTRFNNRKLTFNFSIIGSNQLSVYSDFKNAVHGQKVKIVLDNDSNFYYYGRVSVGDYSWSKGIGSVTVECDCDPWKYHNVETNITLNGYSFQNISVDRKSVVPTITATGEGTLYFNGQSFSFSEGTFTVPEIIFKHDANNECEWDSDSGQITFTFREGSF